MKLNFKGKPYVAIEALRGKKIAVVGAGIEGLSSEKFFEEKGAEVTLFDQRDGKDYLKDLEGYDLIIRSPGVKLDKINDQ